MSRAMLYWSLPLALATAAAAGEFWDSKPASEWNDKDVAEVDDEVSLGQAGGDAVQC